MVSLPLSSPIKNQDARGPGNERSLFPSARQEAGGKWADFEMAKEHLKKEVDWPADFSLTSCKVEV